MKSYSLISLATIHFSFFFHFEVLSIATTSFRKYNSQRFYFMLKMKNLDTSIREKMDRFIQIFIFRFNIICSVCHLSFKPDRVSFRFMTNKAEYIPAVGSRFFLGGRLFAKQRRMSKCVLSFIPKQSGRKNTCSKETGRP